MDTENPTPPQRDLEEVARVAGELELEGFFLPCSDRRAAVVAVVSHGLPDGSAESVDLLRHASACMHCASSLDTLDRRLSDLEDRSTQRDPSAGRAKNSLRRDKNSLRAPGVREHRRSVLQAARRLRAPGRGPHTSPGRRTLVLGALATAFATVALITVTVLPHRSAPRRAAVAAPGAAPRPGTAGHHGAARPAASPVPASEHARSRAASKARLGTRGRRRRAAAAPARTVTRHPAARPRRYRARHHARQGAPAQSVVVSAPALQTAPAPTVGDHVAVASVPVRPRRPRARSSVWAGDFNP